MTLLGTALSWWYQSAPNDGGHLLEQVLEHLQRELEEGSTLDTSGSCAMYARKRIGTAVLIQQEEEFQILIDAPACADAGIEAVFCWIVCKNGKMTIEFFAEGGAEQFVELLPDDMTKLEPILDLFRAAQVNETTH